MVERKGRESLNEEAEWRPLYGGAPGGGSLNKEVKWSPTTWTPLSQKPPPL